MPAATAIRPARHGIAWHGSWTPSVAHELAAVAELPALERLLLTIDGTVTTALQTLAGEPVGVHTLGLETVTIDDDEELALRQGAEVLERRVLLRGAATGAPLLYGASRIVLHRLPRAAREDLLAGTIAIGVVLRAHEIETFRAPLRIGILPASDAAAEHLGPGRMCSRRYAIVAGGRPAMIVDEQFPLAGLGER